MTEPIDLTPLVRDITPVADQAVLDEIQASREAIRLDTSWHATVHLQWPVDHRKEALEYERRWRAATRRLGSLPEPGYESHAVFTARGAHDLACKHLIAAINERLHP